MIISQSSILTNFSQNLKAPDKGGLDLPEQHVEKIYQVLISGASDFLRMVKSKETPTALAIEDLKGNLLLAAIVKYHPNDENPDMPGNWSYEWTFSKEDLNGVKVFKLTDPQTLNFFSARALKEHSFTFNSSVFEITLLTECAIVLNNWLDVNAKDGEEVTLEMPGYFIASVVVEKGEKVKSFVPDGAMKRLIKDDAGLE